MNRKITKYNEEIVRTEKKIAELQAYLKGIRSALREVENDEIIKSIRGMKLDSKELVEMLEKIQDGTLSFQSNEEPESEKEEGSFQYQDNLLEEEREEEQDYEKKEIE